MPSEKLYLKLNVAAEPLIDHWYAWAYLIPPASKSMITSQRHIKIMESYIKNPLIHIAAAKNPALLGSSFANLKEEQLEDVKHLLEKTKESNLNNLSGPILALDKMLQTSAKGNSLEPFYNDIPEPLKGYVELVYDLNSQPSFRLIEALLYKSKHYLPQIQSFMLSLIDKDERPSVLSTPRLQTKNDFHLKIAFHERAVDELFKMKYTPHTVEEISNILSINDKRLYQNFFTPDSPPTPPKYKEPGVRWRYFGHACILLESKSLSILIDPLISYRYQSDVDRYTYADLPETIDFVLLTHNHQDHISFETMLQIRNKVKCLIVPRGGSGTLQDPSLKLIFQQIGFKNVVEIGEMEDISCINGSITGIPFLGEHCDLNIQSKTAYCVRLENHSFLFAADSNNISPQLYQQIYKHIGDIDTLFLGMECDGAPLSWVYGPLLSAPLKYEHDQSRRLTGGNAKRSIEIVNCFNFKEVYIYAMGLEPWLTHVSNTKFDAQSNPIIESNQFIELCKNFGKHAVRLFGMHERIISS